MYDEAATAPGVPLHSLVVQHRMPLSLAGFISHLSAITQCTRAD